MIRIPGFMFEAVIDGGGGMGGGAVEPVASPEPVAPAAPEPVAPAADPAPAAAAIDYDDPRLQDLIQNQASQIAQQTLEQMVQRSQMQQTQPQQGFDPSQLLDEYGNVNPAALATLMQQQQQTTLQAVQEMFTPLASQMQAQQEAETIASGEARLEDILADDIARNGDFVRAAGNTPELVAQAQEADKAARALVRTTADQMFPEIAQRYGATPRAAEIAMGRAADQVRSLLRVAGQSAQAAQANQLATLAGQHGEPGSAGTSAVSRPVVKFGERVTDRYAAGGPPVQ